MSQDRDTKTTGQVISFEQSLRERGGDDARFLCCPSCGAEEFTVVVRFASGRPFIAGLVCVRCDPPLEIGVVNGILDHD